MTKTLVTEAEIFAMALMLETNIYVYMTDQDIWQLFLKCGYLKIVCDPMRIVFTSTT